MSGTRLDELERRGQGVQADVYVAVRARDWRDLLAVARAAVRSHDHRQALVGGTCETCSALAPLLQPAEPEDA